jgi:hypothetical protein
MKKYKSILLVLSISIMGFLLMPLTVFAASAPSAEIAPFVSVPRAQSLVMKAFGDKGTSIVSRMITRVTTPLAIQRDISYAPIQNPSSHWGGYQIMSSYNVNDSEGCFNVTQSTNGDDAAWTGVGGVYETQMLAQTGVDMYGLQAWTECYDPHSNNNHASFWFGVQPGDDMASLVIQDSGRFWYLMIADETSGDWYGSDVFFSPDQSSAEWIIERTTSTIGSYGTVQFHDCMWDDANFNAQTIDSTEDNFWYLDPENGTDRSPVYPNNFGSDGAGKSFTMTAN